MATPRFIFGIICLIGTIGNWLPDRHLLAGKLIGLVGFLGAVELKVGAADLLRAEAVEAKRLLIIEIAQGQVGVREFGGNNRGEQVSKYLAYTNLKQGQPWCAAFVSWVYGKAGYQKPISAWSPSLFPKEQITVLPKPADVFGIYFPKLKRIAHCGVIEKTKRDWVVTIEGNTNNAGSNDGDGVYRKWRHRKTIAVYSNWLKQEGGTDD